MKPKNVVIATLCGVVLFTSFPNMTGNNEVAKVAFASADVPLAKELPFLYGHNFDMTLNVQKEGIISNEAVEIPNATPIAYMQEEEKGAEDSFYDVPISKDLQKFTRDLCGDDVSFELILAIMYKESGFDASKVSKTNDYGIMQINKGNFNNVSRYIKEEYNTSFDWEDPYQNIAAGVYWFRTVRGEMLSYGFSEEQIFPISILAYNMGAPKARQYLKTHKATDWGYVKDISSIKTKIEKGEAL
jgi:hypothetical protein